MTCISIIVPCRNERAYVDAFLDSVFAQQLEPGDTLQLVVADGASDDGTRERLFERAAADRRLIVIDNPGRIVSTGLNRAVARAEGEVIVRMDVHTVYAEDYVRQCVRVLETTGATCVGGPWMPQASAGRARAIGRAIARAFASGFGSGGAASRRADFEGEVDTVYLGAWRRAELLRLGGFDEALVRNQDDELNLRIRRSGGRVWQSPTIRSWYTPRASFTALARQFWQYGYWKLAVIRKHRLPASARHLMPFGFIALAALLAVWGLAWRPAWSALAALIAVYAGMALGSAARLAPPWREPGQWLAIGWAYACMHFSYGLGFARGIWDAWRGRFGQGEGSTRLTR